MLFKVINGYSNYEIDNWGNVFIRTNILTQGTGKKMKMRESKNGLAMVLLVDDNNIRKWVEIKTLINQNFSDDEMNA
jgi:hypothetical protein